MKAAVLYQLGQAPKYAEFADPLPENESQILVSVKAASVKNLDKGRASGAHYGSYTHLPVVVGMDGVGTLHDGSRIYAIGITGMIAEKALVTRNNYVKLPELIDNVTAAALPNAVMGAGAALRFRAGMQKGDTVLINGATGVTGMIAVQIAKHYDAKKIIVTGRNAESLQKLKALGADEIISLKQEDAQIVSRIKEMHSLAPIDVVIDYTWGHPAELILSALKGGGVHANTTRVRYVTVGGIAGETIQLSSGILRSSAIEILGSGLGSLSKSEMDRLFSELLPDMFELAATGKLKIETVTAELKDIETAWKQDIGPGKRLVIAI